MQSIFSFLEQLVGDHDHCQPWMHYLHDQITNFVIYMLSNNKCNYYCYTKYIYTIIVLIK